MRTDYVEVCHSPQDDTAEGNILRDMIALDAGRLGEDEVPTLLGFIAASCGARLGATFLAYLDTVQQAQAAEMRGEHTKANELRRESDRIYKQVPLEWCWKDVQDRLSPLEREAVDVTDFEDGYDYLLPGNRIVRVWIDTDRWEPDGTDRDGPCPCCGDGTIRECDQRTFDALQADGDIVEIDGNPHLRAKGASR